MKLFLEFVVVLGIKKQQNTLCESVFLLFVVVPGINNKNLFWACFLMVCAGPGIKERRKPLSAKWFFIVCVVPGFKIEQPVNQPRSMLINTCAHTCTRANKQIGKTSKLTNKQTHKQTNTQASQPASKQASKVFLVPGIKTQQKHVLTLFFCVCCSWHQQKAKNMSWMCFLVVCPVPGITNQQETLVEHVFFMVFVVPGIKKQRKPLSGNGFW